MLTNSISGYSPQTILRCLLLHPIGVEDDLQKPRTDSDAGRVSKATVINKAMRKT